MADSDMAGSAAVLRRKIEAASKLKAGPETGARAWRVALARAARDGLGLMLDAVSVRDDRQSLVELLELPPDRSLCLVLEGPAEGLGLLVLSPEVLASVIEVQTMGEVSAHPPLLRRPTRTDAAMSVRFVDHALGLLENALAASVDLTWTAGFRYASFLEDARPLALLLEDIPYRILRLDLDIADGRRKGQVILALPAEGRGPKPRSQPRARPDTPEQERKWQAGLSEAVSGAETLLDAQIARFRLPLQQAMALEVGMILPLGAARVDMVALIGTEGAQIAQGKLGQHRGMRALRLADPVTGRPADPRPDPASAAVALTVAPPTVAVSAQPVAEHGHSEPMARAV